MKKPYKRIISLALCMLLLFGVVGVSALAECTGINAGDYAKLPYKCYTSLGDSVPWGYGLQEEGLDTGNVKSVGMRVAGAYPDLIGKVLEQNNKAAVHFASSSGSRVSEFRTLLEKGLGYSNPYTHEGDAYAIRKPERAAALYSKGPQVVKWLGKSDLVTFQAGFNDITAALINVACGSGLVDLNAIDGIKDVNSALNYIQDTLESTNYGSKVPANITKAFNREMTSILENIDAVIGEVVKATPNNADIIVVGYYNVIASFTFIPNTESILFNLLNTGIQMLNDYYSLIADKYDNVYYVSASDAATFYARRTSIVDVLSDIDNALLGIHPNAEGQEYIAKTILNELKELNTCHHKHIETIRRNCEFDGSYGVFDVKVCSDCGEVLSYGKVTTPVGVFDVPEQTIDYVTKTVYNSVTYVGTKLMGQLSSLLGW